jgi:primary-amine oxidase
VISGISTIGNYVYGFFWYFYQDGTIGVEVKATGIPFPTGTAIGAESDYGQIIAPGIDSHAHQHVFSYRFDMAVDGDSNAVREVNFAGAPMGPGNPYGNVIRIEETALKSELQARRNLDFATQRYWKIVNTSSLNQLGQPVAYKLVPGVNALPYLDPQSPVGKRAGFMFHHFWATQYQPDELYPCGWYPNQHAGGDGLPLWTKADRPLENENVVVWYTLNYHHLPRPEDWPVQPVVYAGFHWMPFGFFDENPAMDVPPPTPGASCCC